MVFLQYVTVLTHSSRRFLKKKSHTQVHIACQDGRVDVLEMLRDIGHADMNLRDAFGRTCSDLVRLMTDAMSEMTRRKVLNYLNDLNVDEDDEDDEDTTCSSSNMKNTDEIKSEGGWQSPSESTMNWLQDVLDTARHVDVFSATDLNRTMFLRDFVSLRRPVLILMPRSAIRPHGHERACWSAWEIKL